MYHCRTSRRRFPYCFQMIRTERIAMEMRFLPNPTKIDSFHRPLQFSDLFRFENLQTSSIVAYIAGFVQRKVLDIVQDCEGCTASILAKQISEATQLIATKSWGKLIVPNSDLYETCVVAEQLFKSETMLTPSHQKLFVLKVLRFAMHKNLFHDLSCQLDHKKN